MNIRCAAALFILSAALLAQSPPPCPADRPVDDILAEVHKQQSKRSSRNPNPFPENICIWGWCRNLSKTPPTVPQPAPRAGIPSGEQMPAGATSSSRSAADKCNAAMERALEAAHNVDVGDYYFAEKNYKAALLRYKDALPDKPEDSAIRVRLGRAFEKLNQLPQAIEQYQTAEKLAGPEKWSEEARAALARLQPAPRS